MVSKESKHAKYFKQEISILKSINHPNIPHIIDTFSDEKNIYAVETYIQGTSLHDKIAMVGRLEKEEALLYFIQLAELLEYLHNQRPYPIIYKDLKPNNIIVTHNNRLVLIDFSISKIQKEIQMDKTVIAGNLYYSSPEQMSLDEGSDERSDIYSLGTLITKLLTGRIKENIHRQLEEDQLIPRELKEVLIKCTQKEKGERFQTASELLATLRYLESFEKVVTYSGCKKVLVDGAINTGKSTIISNLANLYAKKDVSVAILDLTYEIGLAAYLDFQDGENIENILEEKDTYKIKKAAHKVGRNISVFKGEIEREDQVISFINRLSKCYQIVLVEQNFKEDFTNIYEYVDEIVLITKQEEKYISLTNKKIVEYLDKNVRLNDIKLVINQYIRDDLSKIEMLESFNLIPELFKKADKITQLKTVRNVERQTFLKQSRRGQALYYKDNEFEMDIEDLANDLYLFEVESIKKGMVRKIGVY